MPVPSDNENWIIEVADAVIRKEVRVGIQGLTPWERLVYCLWVADYGMRNAGDLDTAGDLYAAFQADACRAAEELSLPLTHSAFAQTKSALEQTYLDQFELICDEIKRADPAHQ